MRRFISLILALTLACACAAAEITASTRIIADYAYERSSLTDVVLPDTVEVIGEGAYYKSSLRSIALPNSLKEIKSYAFDHCEQLTSINIPGSVENIGEGAFNYCMRLDDLQLSEGIRTIGANAFSCCFSLRSVVFPSTLTSIGDNAFLNIRALEKAYIPDTIKHIGDSAFAGNPKLTIHTTLGSQAHIYAFNNGILYDTQNNDMQYKNYSVFFTDAHWDNNQKIYTIRTGETTKLYAKDNATNVLYDISSIPGMTLANSDYSSYNCEIDIDGTIRTLYTGLSRFELLLNDIVLCDFSINVLNYADWNEYEKTLWNNHKLCRNEHIWSDVYYDAKHPHEGRVICSICLSQESTGEKLTSNVCCDCLDHFIYERDTCFRCINNVFTIRLKTNTFEKINSVANGESEISACIFDKENIANAYYLLGGPRYNHIFGHTALLLTDKNGNGMHLCYYKDSVVTIKFLSKDEVENFFVNGAIYSQVGSNKMRGDYTNYYAALNCSVLVKDYAEVYERCYKYFCSARDGELVYDLLYQNCDDIAHAVLFDDNYSASAIPTNTINTLKDSVMAKDESEDSYFVFSKPYVKDNPTNSAPSSMSSS